MRLPVPLAVVAALLSAGMMLPAQVPFGSPTPGSGGIAPVLTGGDPFMGNANFELRISNGLGGASAFLAVSTARVTTLFGPTAIYVNIVPPDPVLFLPLPLSGTAGVPGAGTAVLPLALSGPPDPNAAGLCFYAQGAVVDPAVASGIAATAGLRLELSLPPRVFVGTSVGGSNDPTWLIDPAGQTVVQNLTSGTNNVTDAEFAYGGRRIYVGTSLGSQIAELDTAAAVPGYTTFWATSGVTYGIGFDKERKILYTASDGVTGSRELVALDAQVGSPTYGQVIGTTNGLGSLLLLERWELSPSGNVAAVLDVLGGALYIVDTDPSSPGYLTFTNAGPIPSAPGSIFTLANNCKITPGDEQVVIVIQQVGPSEVARYDLANAAFIDHDVSTPAIDNIGPLSSPPAALPSGLTGIDMSRDGGVVPVAGISGGIGRVDVDPQNPLAWSYTSYPGTAASPNTWACAVSNDSSVVAYTTWGGGPGSPGAASLVLIDALTGAQIGTVSLGSAANIYTCRWH